MKRNVLAYGALVLGMIAGFVVRGTLETADAIPPQTQAAAEMITDARPTPPPALQHRAAEDSAEYRMFLQVQEKTETGYVAVSKYEKETELLPEPMHRVSFANMDLSGMTPIPRLAPSRIQDERWDEDVNYAVTWDAAAGWFDYGRFKPLTTEEREIFRFFMSGMR